jgi:hypothetical protein
MQKKCIQKIESFDALRIGLALLFCCWPDVAKSLCCLKFCRVFHPYSPTSHTSHYSNSDLMAMAVVDDVVVAAAPKVYSHPMQIDNGYNVDVTKLSTNPQRIPARHLTLEHRTTRIKASLYPSYIATHN